LQDVTAQKASQDALRSAHALLASVVDCLPCGLSVFDADLRLVAHNRQFRTLQGFPDRLFAPEVVTFESLIRHNAQQGEYGDGPPEEAVRKIVEQARQAQPHHLQRTRKNGVTLDIRGAPLPGGGFVTTYVDMTAAKAAEAALRESEERQKRALDASRLVLWDMDLATGRLYLSENWSELMGGPARPLVTTAGELAGRIPREDQERMAPAMVAMLKGTSEGYDLEHRVRRDDGSLVWIRSQGRVTQRDATGRALRATGTNQDVSARRQAQEELARAAAITRGTLESTTDGIVVVTEKREILYHNRQFLQMWDVPAAMADSPQPQLVAHVLAQWREPQAHARQIDDIYRGAARETFDVLELLDGRVIERYGRPLEVAVELPRRDRQDPRRGRDPARKGSGRGGQSRQERVSR
jgi:PAS domain S-box-containing protein